MILHYGENGKSNIQTKLLFKYIDCDAKLIILYKSDF
jgi:hypothetical protein